MEQRSSHSDGSARTIVPSANRPTSPASRYTCRWPARRSAPWPPRRSPISYRGARRCGGPSQAFGDPCSSNAAARASFQSRIADGRPRHVGRTTIRRLSGSGLALSWNECRNVLPRGSNNLSAIQSCSASHAYAKSTAKEGALICAVCRPTGQRAEALSCCRLWLQNTLNLVEWAS